MDSASILQVIKDVADEVIMPRFRSLDPDQIAEKNPGDLVTVADQDSERLLTAALTSWFPGAVVIGEEATAADPTILRAAGTADHVFFVDPVDGTKNFVAGSEDFGVMVSEMRGAEATRSWIWHPVHGDAWVAERGAGITRNGETVVRAVGREAPLGAISNPPQAGEYPEATLLNSWHSCAIDYPKLATGDIDFLIYRATNPWDHVPGMVIVGELDGTTILPDGSAYRGERSDGGLGAFVSEELAHDMQPLLERLSQDRINAQ